MRRLVIPNRFPHWNEYISVMEYTNIHTLIVNMGTGSLDYEYTDPLNETHPIFNSFMVHDKDIMLIPGNVQRWTHPLSKGKIPYTSVKDKIFTNHTSGWSPWDQVDMLELALMRFRNEINNQGTNGVYILSKKFYDRFLKVDWTNEKYKVLANDIEESVRLRTTLVSNFEPSQFWLRMVPKKCERKSDTIGVALNWSQFQTVENMNKIKEQLIKIHNYTGKKIHIKLHEMLKKDFGRLVVGLDYILINKFEELDKFKFMDMYDTYLVDGTGLGYEIAYRAKLQGDDINIFYFSDLEARYNEFLGIEEMKVVPEKTDVDFLNGVDKSNYSTEVLRLTYPHNNDPAKMLAELSEVINKSINMLNENGGNK